MSGPGADRKRSGVLALHLFNHRFEANLPVLDMLYAGRFPRRHVLMPFASNPGPDISRVHDAGRNFAAFFAEAARDFLSGDISHYVVIPDDLLLNPHLDAGNFAARLELAGGEAWINNLVSADALRWRWPHAGEAAASFERYAKALDIGDLLPPADEARARFEKLGVTFPGPHRPAMGERRKLWRQSKWCWLSALAMRGRPAPYPLLAGYSDFLVIPGDRMEAFCHYCGVLGAMNIFAEVAVPTALALACDRVKTHQPLNTHFQGPEAQAADPASLRPVAFWEQGDDADWRGLLAGDLDAIHAGFPEDVLFVHPVKLSRFA